MEFVMKFGSYVLTSGFLGTAIFHTTNLKRVGVAVEPYEWNNEWDERAANQPISQFTRNILLVRHGQYNLAPRGAAADRTLTRTGILQARAVGLYIGQLRRTLLPDIPITTIRSSNMIRAIQTADHATTEENDFPHYDQLTMTRQYFDEGYPVTTDPRLNAKIGHGPTADRMNDGFRRAFGRLPISARSDTLEVYFVHSNLIRFFVCKALQLPVSAWGRFSLNHGSVTWLKIYGDGTIRCNMLGDSSFLERQLISK